MHTIDGMTFAICDHDLIAQIPFTEERARRLLAFVRDKSNEHMVWECIWLTEDGDLVHSPDEIPGAQLFHFHTLSRPNVPYEFDFATCDHTGSTALRIIVQSGCAWSLDEEPDAQVVLQHDWPLLIRPFKDVMSA